MLISAASSFNGRRDAKLQAAYADQP